MCKACHGVLSEYICSVSYLAVVITCSLFFPQNYGERLLAQIIGAIAMIGVTAIGTFLMYGFLYIIPIKPFIWVFERIFRLNPGQRMPPLRYVGGWLLTHPDEDFRMQDMPHIQPHGLPMESDAESPSMSTARKKRNTKVQVNIPFSMETEYHVR